MGNYNNLSEEDTRAMFIDPVINKKWSQEQVRRETCFTDGRIIVRGPGQNFSAKVYTISGIAEAISVIISSFDICTIRGLSQGRFFAAKIFLTASSLVASAPRP